MGESSLPHLDTTVPGMTLSFSLVLVFSCFHFTSLPFPQRNAGVPQGHVRVRPEGRVLRHHRARQARQPLPQRRAEVERNLRGAGRPAARVLHDALRRSLQERDPGKDFAACGWVIGAVELLMKALHK